MDQSVQINLKVKGLKFHLRSALSLFFMQLTLENFVFFDNHRLHLRQEVRGRLISQPFAILGEGKAAT